MKESDTRNLESNPPDDYDRTVVLPGSQPKPRPTTPPHSPTATGASITQLVVQNGTTLKATATQVIGSLIGRRRRNVDEELESDSKVAPVKLEIDSETVTGLGDINFNYVPGVIFAEGGQGIIAKAFDKSLTREVALKSLRDNLKNDEQARREFISEARITATLDHPAIVPIYSLSSDRENGLHLAMKMIRGKSLKSYLDKVCERYHAGGAHSFDEASSMNYRIDIFLRVCDAMSYAHARGVIHRDLKPENIMIGDFREAYIMDWGIARFTNDAGQVNADSSKRIIGTPRYLAPEVLNNGSWDVRSDIYALGLILFECVTLKVAFPGDSVKTTVAKVKSHQMEPVVHRFGNRIEPDLAAIIHKATAFLPENRYQSVSDLAVDLRRYLRGEEVSANPDNLIAKILRWSNRHRRSVFTVALLMLLCGMTMTAVNLQHQMTRAEIDRRHEKAINLAYASALRTANQIDRSLTHVSHLLSLLEANTSFLLHDPVASTQKTTPRFYSSADLKSPETRPPGTIYSEALREYMDFNDFSYVLPSDMTYAEAEKYLRLLLPVREQMLETVYDSIHDVVFTSKNLTELRRLAEKGELPVLWAYIGLSNGLFISMPGRDGFPPGYDPRLRPWYAAALPGNGEPVWGKPYFDAGTGGFGVITCSMLIRDFYGHDYGVAAVDVSFYHLIKLMRESSVRNSESVIYRALVDSEGNYLVGTGQGIPDKAMGRSPFIRNEKIWREITHKRYGNITRNEDGRDVLTIYAYIPGLDWYYLEKFDLLRLLAQN